jgi:SAM-dependent methyltransferase
MGREWIVVQDAKVLRLEEGRSPDEKWLSGLHSQISYWNSYALDPRNGYEIMTRRLKYVAPRTMVEMAAPYLSPDVPILELGTGTGLVGELLAVRGLTFDGIDFSREMLNAARLRGYRDLVCADLRQPDLRLVLKRSYAACISVGVYGDFVDVRWLHAAIKALEEHAVIAVCGRADELLHLHRILERNGFAIKEVRKEFAHYTIDFSPREYLYVVATRG